MKRLAMFAAVLAVAACTTAEKPADTMRTDTTAPAMAPAPMDSAAHNAMMRDSMARDSVAKAGTKGTKGTKKTP